MIIFITNIFSFSVGTRTTKAVLTAPMTNICLLPTQSNFLPFDFSKLVYFWPNIISEVVCHNFKGFLFLFGIRWLLVNAFCWLYKVKNQALFYGYQKKKKKRRFFWGWGFRSQEWLFMKVFLMWLGNKYRRAPFYALIVTII